MKDTYIYQIGESLYVNLTNRCSNRCTFCVREGKETYDGYSLWLKGKEPSAEQIEEEIGDPKKYREVVFCGFGEPTERLGVMYAVCDFVHARGGKTRLNTNGHGSLLNGRNLAPELAKYIDGVNISLNAPTKEEYERICRPLIPGAYEGMLRFARDCKEAGVNAWFSVVDFIGKEKIEACERIAKETGIPLRVRETIN